MKKKKSSKSDGLYRDVNTLVIREGASFPARCPLCNKPADGEPLACTFERKSARYVEVAAVQKVATAASDLISGTRYTGPVEAVIPLCSWHRGRRIRLALFGLGMVAVAVAVLMIQKALGIVIVPPGEMGFLHIALYNFLAFGAIFAGITFMLMATFDSQKLWFRATRYQDRYVWVSGAGREFLRELPKVEDRHFEIEPESRELTAEELIRRSRYRE
ncbi:MAG: hypothetical protein U0744_13950 [Gemmataceae bacterium]